MLHQPNEGQIVVHLAFKFPRALYSIRISIQEQFQHAPGIILAVSYLLVIDLDPQLSKIKCVYKGIVGANGVIPDTY